MNIEQTLEELDSSIRHWHGCSVNTIPRLQKIFKERMMVLQSLRDDLPALIGAKEDAEQWRSAVLEYEAERTKLRKENESLRRDAETLRKMKEAGPAGYLANDGTIWFGERLALDYCAIKIGRNYKHLYALPDEVTK